MISRETPAVRSIDATPNPLRVMLTRVTLLLVMVTISMPGDAQAKESTEESIAAYADAANFQTNGAFDLAIKSWQDFLKEYPKDDLASKAAHYLGVCHMQKESPDYVAAAKAFEQALSDEKFELREESLANQGWCWYASSGEEPNRDKKRLRATLSAYQKLQREKPKSQFLDRALFYSGEASYGLGDRKQAIKYYNKLISLPNAKDSPLRCNALYARGIAHEELDQFDSALASFNQLLSSCDDDDLLTDVHTRMGDVRIYRKEYAKAIESFSSAIKTAESDDDKSYAIFRQAFAMVRADRPSDAAKNYDRLQKEFPNSKYAGTAMLSSAQSTYRSGDLDKAAKSFLQVLKQDNKASSTEAAHWLSRIYISQGNPDEAAKIAKRQIDSGVDGDYAVELKLDYAEALSLNPKTIKDSVAAAEAVYKQSPKSPLAPRALYNAAFSALQTNQHDKALNLATEFLSKFPKDTLVPDVQFISAESNLLTGKLDQAAASYEKLLKQTPPQGNVQRPLWVLRAATTSNAARKYDQTVGLLRREFNTLTQPIQKAEAQMLLGQAYLMSKKYNDAALAFQKSHDADPKWPRADEAQFLASTALMSGGKVDQAKSIWQRLISTRGNTRMADQSRYKLAQLAASKGDQATAVKLYDEIVASKRDPGLMPYALYGKSSTLMQNDQHQKAIEPLNRLLKDYKNHPVGDDALLARGISLRHVNKFDDAAEDLTEYLIMKPKGNNLGHALYELALIDQQKKRPEKAVTRLQKLAREVPKYPSMDKVLYELAWSLRESGDDKAAEKAFADLVRRFPKADVAGEAAYFVGQRNYAEGKWKEAAKQFLVATQRTKDAKLSEKAHYRLGWSHFKSRDFKNAEKAFKDQAEKHANGKLALDAKMMVGECRFEVKDYAGALEAYSVARDQIRKNNDTSRSIDDKAERQVRELIMLHGGQSAGQLKQWDAAIGWFDELKERFPSTSYAPQLFYETGYAYQQKNDKQKALNYFSDIANKQRTELGARSRFMIGEIYFGDKEFDKAIDAFQRVMFGYGAEKAPEANQELASQEWL